MINSLVILACLLAGFSQASHAHDPGISFASVQVMQNLIRMQLSFSQTDIESLVAADTGWNDSISQADIENILLDTKNIILDGVYFRINNIRTTAEKVQVASALSETIKVTLEFSYQGQKAVMLLAPVLERLSRGHRQHLRVLDSEGEIQFQKILDAAAGPVMINASKAGRAGIFQQYVVKGVWHIWIGFDHILFLVTLLLPAVLVFGNQQWSTVQKFLPALVDTLKIVTAFTVAHSITLGLAVSEIVQLPSRLVESVIAFSVLIVALNNLWPLFSSSRWLLDSEGEIQFQKILDAAAGPVMINASKAGRAGIFQQYVVKGVWHIWIGFDHILFLVTLLLPAVLVFGNQQWSTVQKFLPALVDTLKIVTAFTVAHSITLGLAVSEIVQLPSRLVESVIAFSVLIVALNNLWPLFSSSRWLLAFVFGLIHGFGFASVLVDLGLHPGALLYSLAGFNLGVEVGQLAIVAIVVPLFYLIRHSVIYRKWIFSGGSVMAALVASVWMVERIYGIAMPLGGQLRFLG